MEYIPDHGDLRQMAAMIAGGIASVRGHDEPETTARRSIAIAMEIDAQVGVLEKVQNAQQPDGQPPEAAATA